MHAMQRWATTALAGRRLRRAGCAAVCLTAVLLGHGALWLAASQGAVPGGVRPAALQVRHLTLPAAAAEALPTEPTIPVVPPARTARVAAVPRSGAVLSPQATTARAMATQADGTAAPDAPDGLPPSAMAALSPASPVETYATRIPSSTQLNFTLQRGTAAGEATLHWQVDAGRYLLQLQATLPQGRAIEQRSQGGFDEAGLAPERLADRRRGRDVRAANFQREQGKISFSGPRWEWPLHGGAQDRLSWLVQLVAIAAAAPDAMHEGAELSMWVAGTRGALNVWRFEVRGRQQLPAPSGDAPVWWLVREPEHPYDLRVEVWLDPTRGHWPLKLRQTQVPGGEPLEWTLRDEPQSALGS